MPRIETKNFLEDLPREVVLEDIIASNFDLTDLARAGQTSKSWMGICVNEANLTKTQFMKIVKNEIRAIHDADPVSEEIVQFFVNNRVVIGDKEQGSEIRRLFSELVAKLYKDANPKKHKECAKRRWFLWENFISKKAEYNDLIENTMRFLKKDVDQILKKSGAEVIFDVLQENLKAAVKDDKSIQQAIQNVWGRAFVPLCALTLSLGLVNQQNARDITSVTLEFTEKQWKITNFTTIPKQLRMNIPFLLQLLNSHEVDIRQIWRARAVKICGIPDEETHFGKMIDSLDPVCPVYPDGTVNKSYKEKQKICAVVKEVLAEIGRMLLAGDKVCLGPWDIKKVARLNNPVLIERCLKKYIELSDSFKLLSSEEMENPRVAKRLLVSLKEEKVKSIKTRYGTRIRRRDIGSVLLYNVIKHLLSSSSKSNLHEKEISKMQWLEVAILLLERGEETIETIYDVLTIAKDQKLEELVIVLEEFIKNPSITRCKAEEIIAATRKEELEK